MKVDLGKLVEGSQLVNGFATPLPTLGDVRNEISKQRIAIVSGTYEEHGAFIGRVGSANDPLPISPLLPQNSVSATPLTLNPQFPNGGFRDGTVVLGYGVYSIGTKFAP